MTETTGSPGSTSDRRNWNPADSFYDYLRNCEAGLEVYSDRRAAKLLGVPRVKLWRWKSMARIPDELFERLLRLPGHLPSRKELAEIGRALHGEGGKEVERCWCCGAVQRVRNRWRKETEQTVNEWLLEQKE